MSIISLKFANGDEIIARCTDPTALVLKLESPRVIGIQETSTGAVGLGFMPWLLSNPDATIQMAADKALVISEPKADIEKAYLQQTSRIHLAG